MMWLKKKLKRWGNLFKKSKKKQLQTTEPLNNNLDGKKEKYIRQKKLILVNGVGFTPIGRKNYWI